MFSTFYNESIRKLVIGFGSLFNNLNIRYFNADGTVNQTVRVPVSYSPKEKFIARLNEGGSIVVRAGGRLQAATAMVSADRSFGLVEKFISPDFGHCST